MNGREPVLVAGGITGVIALVLGAFWAVIHDAGLATWLQPSTVDLINGAIIAVVAFASNFWARQLVTPIKSAVLAIGTKLRTPSGTEAVVKAS